MGYDINFHACKSASLLYGLTEDPAILEAFRTAVRDTMTEMEADTRTRIRKDRKQEEHVSGNWAYGLFVHLTARPEQGVPDPHLHAHCFVPNASWCEAERTWKAIDIATIKRDAPYFEAGFQARFARNLQEAGYAVARTPGGWEIAGLDDPRLLRNFSRRTEAIEREAARRGIEDPAAKDQLGAKTRSRKAVDLSMEALRGLWKERLTDRDADSVARAAAKVVVQPELPDADQALDYAIRHCFERDSAIPERRLLAEALRHGAGAVTPEEARAALDRPEHGILRRDRDGRALVTTKAVLAEEQALIRLARDGRGGCLPLAGAKRVDAVPEMLDRSQRAVFRGVLQSPDRVMLVRGPAGAGKTRLMQELAQAIEQRAGKQVLAFAPTSDASRGVQRQAGFAAADTVARLLVDTDLQKRIRGQVLWIDEAGMLGVPTLKRLLELADAQQARVILTGDAAQHAAVERGAALRLLEERAGVPAFAITGIRRQKGAYRSAAVALAEGRMLEGFERLDALGWVHELPDEAARHARLARDYLSAIREGKSALAVCPTHREGERLTETLRARLKAEKALGEERDYRRLVPLHRTEAERGDAANYRAGDVLVFHQNGRRGFRKGQRLEVTAENRAALPLDQAARFQVYRAESLPVARGERLRLTAGGTAKNGRRLQSGAIVTVAGFTRTGEVKLEGGAVLPSDWGHWTHGWVSTSHAAQGKTLDRVFLAQGSESFGATSREQFYVSATRAREQVQVYCTAKHALRRAIERSEHGPSASRPGRRPCPRRNPAAPPPPRRPVSVARAAAGARRRPAGGPAATAHGLAGGPLMTLPVEFSCDLLLFMAACGV